MARAERSAGFLIFHRRDHTPEGIRFLLLNYGRHWDFAKGHVDKGESDYEAAVRELHEETGIRAIQPLADFEKEISYFFRSSKHGLIRKTVIFFLAEVRSEDVILSEEHVGYEFLPYEKALKRTTFPAAKELVRTAYAYLVPEKSTEATT